LPQERDDLDLDLVLVGLVQGRLELVGELVDLRVGVAAVVTATLAAEDLRNAGDADTRRDPPEDRGVVRAATEERTPVLSSRVDVLESGFLRRDLEGLERSDTVRVHG